jgi:hypothetical protein
MLCVDVVLWITSTILILHYAQLGKIGRTQSTESINYTSLPSVAVVIVAQEEADRLQKHLPVFLEQQYPSDYQVIVADIHSSDGTKKLLEELEEIYPQLSHTSIPTSARDISMQRLAMTLGAKTACTEWIVFTQADCCPESKEWLASFMNAVTPEKNAIIGFTKYAACDNWLLQKHQFFRLWQQMLWIPFAVNHYPYRADDTLLAYRKEYFFDHNGFASDSKLQVGAATLLVNKNISLQQCAVSIGRKARLLQDKPLPHTWLQEEVFFMETRKHTKYKCQYRTWYALKALLPLLFTLSTIVSIILWYQNSFVTCILVALWIITCIIRDIYFRKTTKQFDINSYHLTLPYFCSLIPLWDIRAWLRWRFTNKREFRKKFV